MAGYTVEEIKARAKKRDMEIQNSVYGKFVDRFNKKYASDYLSQWRTADELSAYYNDLSKLNERTKTLKSYYSLYGNDEQKAKLADIDTSLESFGKILAGKDELIGHYGSYGSADAYNAAMKAIQEEYNYYSNYDIPTAQSELDRLYRDREVFKGFETAVGIGQGLDMPIYGSDGKEIYFSDYFSKYSGDYDLSTEKGRESALDSINPKTRISELEKELSKARAYQSSKLDTNDDFAEYAVSTDRAEKALKKENLDKYFNETEKKRYYYLFNTEGEERASQYAKDILDDLEWRQIQAMYDYADDHFLLGSIASFGTDVASMLEGGVKAFDYWVNAGLEELEDVHTSRLTNAFRSGASADMGEFGQWVYSTVMSVVDSSIARLIPYGNVLRGISNMANGINDALDRGLSDDQAFMTGAYQGIFETLFEGISFGNLNSVKKWMEGLDPKSLRSIVSRFAVTSGINASEEALTETANIIYDSLANGDLSHYSLMVNEYINAGKSPEEAMKAAKADFMKQIGAAAASGAAMGGGMFAGEVGLYYGKNAVDSARYYNKQGKETRSLGDATETISAYTEAAKSFGENTKAAKAAAKYEKKATNYRLGRMVTEVDHEVFRSAPSWTEQKAEIRRAATEEVAETVKNAQDAAKSAQVDTSFADVRFASLPKIADFGGMDAESIVVEDGNGGQVSLSELSMEDAEIAELYSLATTTGSVENANKFIEQYRLHGEQLTPSEFWRGWIGVLTMGEAMTGEGAMEEAFRSYASYGLSKAAMTAAYISGVELRTSSDKKYSAEQKKYEDAWNEAKRQTSYLKNRSSGDIINNNSNDNYVAESDTPIYDVHTTLSSVINNVSAEDIAAGIAKAKNEYKVTDDEYFSIEAYVKGRAYDLSRLQRAGDDAEWSELDTYLVENIKSGLLKHPTYSGRTYRNLSFSSVFNTETDYEDFIRENAVGNEVTLKAFSSASKNPNGYSVVGDKVVHLVIDGVSARDISETFNIGQEEVVYLPDTKYRVGKATTANDGHPLIYGEEIVSNEVQELSGSAESSGLYRSDETVSKGHRHDTRRVERIGRSSESSGGSGKMEIHEFGPLPSAQKERLREEVNYYSSKFDDSALRGRRLNASHKEYLSFLRVFSRATGANIEVFYSEKGKRAENGSYNRDTNTMRVDINAGISNNANYEATRSAIVHTLSHESIHNMRVTAPTQYEALRDLVLDVLRRDESYDLESAIETEMEKFRKKGENDKGREDAIEEIVARACEDRLGSSETLRDFMIDLYQHDQKAANGFIKAVREFIARLKAFFENISKQKSVTEEAQIIASKGSDIVAEIQKRFDDAILAMREGNAARNAGKGIGEDIESDNTIMYSPRGDVLSWDIAWDSNNHSSIKEQLLAHLDEVNNMQPVTSVNYSPSDGKPYYQQLDEILRTKFGYKIERQDHGSINFDVNGIKGVRKYVYSDAEAAAVIASPYVLKRGKAISGHKNHKDNGHPSVVYAAPATLNGEVGNVAVSVLYGSARRVHSVRVLTPSGKEFILTETENTEPKNGGSVTKSAVEPPISSVSKDSITDFDSKVNTKSEKSSEMRQDREERDEKDFSYDALVTKDDLKVTVIRKNRQVRLTADGSIDTEWILKQAKSKCKIIRTNSSKPTYYVNVPDIGKNVEITNKNIKHGFIKSKTTDKKVYISPKDLLNARVALELPQILSRSIEVNQSSVENNIDVPYRHVMIGSVALEKSDGDLDYYAVRFSVDERRNQNPILAEVNILGRLHAANAKKIDQPTSRGVSNENVALLSGKVYLYSIADFLKDVKGVFNDTFSKDVYEHFGEKRYNDVFSDNLMYQDRIAAETEKSADAADNVMRKERDNQDVSITLADVESLRSIGSKSINQFSSDDVKKTENWAKKFYVELGTKSPFFRAWFGEWRAYDEEQVKIVSVPTIDISQVVLEKGNYFIEDTGWNVYAGKTLNDDTRHHSGGNRVNVKALNAIKEILSNSVLLDTIVSERNTKKKSENTAFLHKLYSLIKYGDQLYIAKSTVEEYYNETIGDVSRRAYNLKAIKIEPVGGQLGNNSSSSRPDTSSTISIADLYGFVKSFDKDFSAAHEVNEYLLNKDGTPKVFYHGTHEQFTAFSTEEIAANEGSFFFAENREDAQAYGKNVFQVYLTGEKFANYDAQPSEFYRLRNKRAQVQYLKERGYDGWYADMDSDGWGEVSVFSPTQIKSATDNIGTFNKSEDNILYQDRIETPEPSEILSELFSQSLYYKGYTEYRKSLEEYKGLVESVEKYERRIADIDEQLEELRSSKSNKGKASRMDTLHRMRETANEKKSECRRRMFALEVGDLQKVIRSEEKKIIAATRDLERQRAKHQRETVVQRQYINSIEKRVKDIREKLLRNSKDKHVPDVFKRPIAEFITAIDFSSERSLDGGKQTARELQLMTALQGVQDMLDSRWQQSSDDEVIPELDLPSSFDEEWKKVRTAIEQLVASRTDEGFRLELMDSNSLRLLNRTLIQLQHSISQANKLIVNAQFQNAIELSTNSINEWSKLARHDNDGKSQAVGNLFEFSNTTPVYFFERLGSAARSIFDAVADGQDKLTLNIARVLDFSKATFTAEQSKKWSKEVHYFEINGVDVFINTAQIMSLYELDKRGQARKHLFDGGAEIDSLKDVEWKDVKNAPERDKEHQKVRNSLDGFVLAQKDIDRIINVLTPEQKRIADAMQKFMAEVGGRWGDEIHMKRYGIRFAGDANYFPVRVSKNAKGQTDEQLQQPRGAQSDLRRLLNISAAQPLNENADERIMISSIFDVFTDHMNDMAAYNAMALPLLDMLKWYNYTYRTKGKVEGTHVTHRLQTELRRAYGGGAVKYLRNFIEDINSAQKVGRGGEFSSKMLSRYKVAQVGANLRTALLQPTSLVRALNLLGFEDVATALVKGINPAIIVRSYERAKEYCPLVLWKSFGFHALDTATPLKEQIAQTQGTKGKIVEGSLKAAEWADNVTIGLLWMACEKRVRKTHPDVEYNSQEFKSKVSELLREVIYKTQVVDSVLTRSDFMRSKDQLAQLSSAFMAEQTLSYNTVQAAYLEISDKRRKGEKIGPKRFIRRMAKPIGVFCLGAIIQAVVESLPDAMRDDGDEEFYKKYLLALLENGISELNPINKLPILKEAAALGNLMINIIFGTEFGVFYSNRMDMAFIESVGNAVLAFSKTFGKALGGEMEFGDVTKTLYQLLKATSQLSGLPINNLVREILSIWNTIVAEFDESLVIEY